MKAIQCFSSKPIDMGRSISGNADTSKKQKELPDYILVTLCLSALQWRKTNGTITLYTDTKFYNYLKSKGVTHFWNDIQCALDNISEKLPGIDHAIFWSACKFYCYLLEKTPFACIDTDIIIWKKLELNPSHSLMFTHWESIEEDDVNYVSKSKLDIAKSYNFIDCNSNIRKGLNMSITALLNEDFKKLFTNEAINFMLNCSKKFDGKYATPEILYMEQVLPIQLATKYKHLISPFIQCTWSPKQFTFTSQDKKLGDWIFNSFNQDQLCTHLWFHKNYIEKCIEARNEYMNNILYVFRNNFPIEYTVIENVLNLKNKY